MNEIEIELARIDKELTTFVKLGEFFSIKENMEKLSLEAKEYRSLFSICEDLKRELDDIRKGDQSRLSTFHILRDEISFLSKEIKSLANLFKQEKDSVSQQFSQIWASIQLLKSDMCKSATSDEVMSKHKAAIGYIEALKTTLISHGNSLSTFPVQLSDFKEQMRGNIDSMMRHLSELSKKQAASESEIKRNLDNELISLEESLRSIVRRLDSMQQFVSVPTQTIDVSKITCDLSQQIEDKMHLPTLEAKNADLRSKNVEVKFFLLEKKLEQLALKIDKLSTP